MPTDRELWFATSAISEQLNVDGEKQLEAIIETHRQKMSLLYARRFDLNQIPKIAGLQEKLPSLNARIDELSRQLSGLANPAARCAMHAWDVP